MGFGEAYVNTQLIYQKLYDSPFYYDATQNKMTENPKRRLKLFQRVLKMPLWHLSQLLTFIFFLYCTAHVYTLSSLLSSNPKIVSLAELISHGFGIAITIQALVTTYTLETNPSYVTYVGSEILQINGIKHVGLPTTARLPDLSELLGYGIAIGFLNFPLIVLAWCLILKVDPISLELQGILPQVPLRILSCSICTFTTVFSANSCASYMLFVLTCCQTLEQLSLENLKMSKMEHRKQMHKCIEKYAMFAVKSGLQLLERIYPNWKNQTKADGNRKRSGRLASSKRCEGFSFETSRTIHNSLCLVMEPCNKNSQAFVPAMTAVGISLCVIAIYCCLKFYTHTEFRVLVIFDGIICILIHWLIFFLCFHASQPAENSAELIHFWKSKELSVLRRRQARALYVYGFWIGPFCQAKKRTALDIMECIVDYTATLLLA